MSVRPQRRRRLDRIAEVLGARSMRSFACRSWCHLSAGPLLLVAAVSLAACATKTHYAWGHYEAAVLAITSQQGQIDVAEWIQKLSQDVERARQEDRPIPPGMHAQLGMLYAMQGQLDTAAAAFESEKELYPESTTFIDGMLTRMRGKS